MKNGVSEEEAQALSDLRDLLFGEERVEITNLQQRLDDPELHAEDISQALPEAILLRSQQDDGLAKALSPIVEESLRVSIRQNLASIAEALYPVIGPAIRRAIAAALQNFIQSMNQIIDHTFTVRGLRWRLEAWRTGCSVAEVAIRHSLVYRVEEVFFIHRESGLPILHLARDANAEGDEAMVAGMLTAIQDFVRHSFDTGGDQQLDAVHFGELNLLVEAGPHAVLAVAVRGMPPTTLRTALQESLEELHEEHAGQLESFDGDSAPFEASRSVLEACMTEKYEVERASQAKAWGIVVCALLAIVFSLGYSAWVSAKRDALTATLNAQPGVMVLSEAEVDGTWVVRGLKDPLASDVTPLVTEAGLEAGDVELRWVPYFANERGLVLKRARKLLGPPESVRVELTSEGVLRLEGEASHRWITRARLVGGSLPGVAGTDDGSLVDADLQALHEHQQVLGAAVNVQFVPHSVRLGADQDVALDALVKRVRELYRCAATLGSRARVWFEPVGLPADQAGRALAKARWDALRGELERRDAPRDLLVEPSWGASVGPVSSRGFSLHCQVVRYD